MKRFLNFFLSMAVLGTAGCWPGAKKITPMQRAQAANFVSEARFAMTLKEWPRAEGLLEKATEICPDAGDYWLALGATRMHLAKRGEAKSAYRSALSDFENDADLHRDNSHPVIQAITTLVLMGRSEEARKALREARSKAPDDRTLKLFFENKEIERMLGDPNLKEISL